MHLGTSIRCLQFVTGCGPLPLDFLPALMQYSTAKLCMSLAALRLRTQMCCSVCLMMAMPSSPRIAA